MVDHEAADYGPVAGASVQVRANAGQPLWCHWCNRDIEEDDRFVILVEPRLYKGKRRRQAKTVLVCTDCFPFHFPRAHRPPAHARTTRTVPPRPVPTDPTPHPDTSIPRGSTVVTPVAGLYREGLDR